MLFDLLFWVFFGGGVGLMFGEVFFDCVLVCFGECCVDEVFDVGMVGMDFDVVVVFDCVVDFVDVGEVDYWIDVLCVEV